MKKSKKTEKPVDERVTVKSNTYGEHQRAKRGTYKEATLNEGMKRSSKEMGISNNDASLIKKELEPYFYNVKPFKFWIRLLSVTRAAYKGCTRLNPEKFINFDVYEEYKISRLAAPAFRVTADPQLITVEVKWSQAPNFNRKFPDGYIYGALCIFVDRSNLRAESEMKYSETFPLNEKNGYCLLEFENRSSYEYALVFLILHPTKEDKPYTAAAASGFRCIWALDLKIFRENLNTVNAVKG